MKLRKILITVALLFIISFIMCTNNVKAILQANSNTPSYKNRDTWMVQIREMEAIDGTLGLEETHNDNLTFSGTSNNLDIHMQKNTEYGAMALLSASDYGKPDKIEYGETTTGNETGALIENNFEWVAAQHTEWYGRTGYDVRYINYYTYSASWQNQYRGDAYLETAGWHDSSYYYTNAAQQFYASRNTAYRYPGGIVRVYGSIFGFHNLAKDVASRADGAWGARIYWNTDSTTVLNNAYQSRAVIVNGEGL